MLIIPTKVYAADEIAQIIAMRAQAENVQLDDGAHKRLSEIGAETSLRYVGVAQRLARSMQLHGATADAVDAARAHRLALGGGRRRRQQVERHVHGREDERTRGLQGRRRGHGEMSDHRGSCLSFSFSFHIPLVSLLHFE